MAILHILRNDLHLAQNKNCFTQTYCLENIVQLFFIAALEGIKKKGGLQQTKMSDIRDVV